MIKLIVALDYPHQDQALALADALDPKVCALKIGSEMFTAFGPDLVKRLVAKQFKVFLDLKFHDIPSTVAKSVAMAADLGVWMINVHASGGLVMLRAAAASLAPLGADKPLLIAVTVLTSFDQVQLSSIGVAGGLIDQVGLLASMAKEAGLDGVVCAGFEVPLVKSRCGENFLTVTPGIRLSTDENADQVRVLTPNDALELGADYLVIGRSITTAKNPAEVVKNILNTM